MVRLANNRFHPFQSISVLSSFSFLSFLSIFLFLSSFRLTILNGNPQLTDTLDPALDLVLDC